MPTRPTVEQLAAQYASEELARQPLAPDSLAGFLQGLKQSVMGYADMVRHPVDTANVLYQAGRNALMNPKSAAVAYVQNELARVREAGQSQNALGQYAGSFVDPLRIARGLSRAGGPVVRQIVSPSQAKQLNTKLQLPDAPEFHSAVANTPGAEITPDGLKLRVARKQLFEQDDADSVRTGVFYLPEGDKNMRHYAKGGTAGNYYGGEQSFSGETLLARPLFVKGATGGKVPEAAYDALMGKGAAIKLNDDARSVATDYMTRRDPGLFREQIAKFLAERGGDPSMADYIIENSKKGNQLTYALQEHVVAHAVRKAGYDGVLGYTSTKAGPRISELFDTREVTYPSEFNDPTIHLDYRPK